jgi:HD superfamily phosphohydrolase
LNKKKIFNDPIYGFISVPSELIFDIIETPVFQRLRRIKQMGLADLVYPGALHTRFHHALGAMHLMGRTLDNLRDKGNEISNQEYEAALIAILLHDIGHGPFSHTLEHTLLKKVDHEDLSLHIMMQLNQQFSGSLDLAINMFSGSYARPFFHQLVSSQLDIDRLDYLRRDSFFTGVSEGTIGADRIIKLLTLVDEEIVVEEKGIYSIENFLNARRLMYWQVYLHKTGVAADVMLRNIINRAKSLSQREKLVGSTAVFSRFLNHEYTFEDFNNTNLMEDFTQLDDFDIWSSIKNWVHHKDPILAYLSRSLLNRNLYKIQLTNQPLVSQYNKFRQDFMADPQIEAANLDYFVSTGSISNAAYMASNQKIRILKKDRTVMDIEKTADLPNIKAISKIVTKHYLCWAKNVSL